MINREQEVLGFLHIPSIPKKKWDGKSAFKQAVAVINNVGGVQSYAVATFDPERHTEPMVTKVFDLVPYTDIADLFVVPSYMDDDVKSFDLADEESRKAAARVLAEAKEMEMEGVEEKGFNIPEDNEYIFDHIHTDEEAQAFIRQYNKQNGIKRGRVPQTHDSIIMRLAAIFAEIHDNGN